MRERERERERDFELELENFFYKDCSSVKNLPNS